MPAGGGEAAAVANYVVVFSEMPELAEDEHEVEALRTCVGGRFKARLARQFFGPTGEFRREHDYEWKAWLNADANRDMAVDKSELVAMQGRGGEHGKRRKTARTRTYRNADKSRVDKETAARTRRARVAISMIQWLGSNVNLRTSVFVR